MLRFPKVAGHFHWTMWCSSDILSTLFLLNLWIIIREKSKRLEISEVIKKTRKEELRYGIKRERIGGR